METIIISMETIVEDQQHIPELTSHLGYWLRRVSNAVSGEFARALETRQTSVAEWVLLHEIHQRGQATPGDLAEALGITRGAVSKVMDKLDGKGWIRSRAKVGDSRSQLLSLTEEGRRSLPVLAGIADEDDEHFFAFLSCEERDALRLLLAKVAYHHGIVGIPTE